MFIFYMALIDDPDDLALFNAIYARNYKKIYWAAYGVLNNSGDAEDISQETWMAVCDIIKMFRGRTDEWTRAYICGMARRKAKGRLRRNERRGDIISDMDEFAGGDPMSDEVLENLCEKCGVEEILSCINSLGETYSQVLRYHFVYKMTIREISQMMNENQNTIGARITRGRKKLKELLERRGYN